jgi:hypothetical protein
MKSQTLVHLGYCLLFFFFFFLETSCSFRGYNCHFFFPHSHNNNSSDSSTTIPVTRKSLLLRVERKGMRKENEKENLQRKHLYTQLILPPEREKEKEIINKQREEEKEKTKKMLVGTHDNGWHREGVH